MILNVPRLICTITLLLLCSSCGCGCKFKRLCHLFSSAQILSFNLLSWASWQKNQELYLGTTRIRFLFFFSWHLYRFFFLRISVLICVAEEYSFLKIMIPSIRPVSCIGLKVISWSTYRSVNTIQNTNKQGQFPPRSGTLCSPKVWPLDLFHRNCLHVLWLPSQAFCLMTNLSFVVCF